jgi:hypothetical protein
VSSGTIFVSCEATIPDNDMTLSYPEVEEEMTNWQQFRQQLSYKNYHGSSSFVFQMKVVVLAMYLHKNFQKLKRI